MRAATLALLGLVGCLSVAQPNATVREGFTAEELASLSRAAAKWNSIVREPIRLDGGEWQIVKADPPDRPTKGYSGETMRGPRLVYIMPGLSPQTFYAVALHELGHVLGLHHVQGCSVMSATICATEFTDADFEECRASGACDLVGVDLAKCRMQGVCR